MWYHVDFYQNGTIQVGNPDRNQLVQGTGRFTTPRRFGGFVKKIDLQSSEGSRSTIWDYRWYEPWRGWL